MEDTPYVRFVYVTLPTPIQPTLNVTIGDTHQRFRVSRDQLINLNAQIADAVLRGRIADEHRFHDNQLWLDLDSAGSA